MNNEQLTQLIDLLDIFRKERHTEFYLQINELSDNASAKSIMAIKELIYQWEKMFEALNTIGVKARSMRGDFCEPV